LLLLLRLLRGDFAIHPRLLLFLRRLLWLLWLLEPLLRREARLLRLHHGLLRCLCVRVLDGLLRLLRLWYLCVWVRHRLLRLLNLLRWHLLLLSEVFILPKHRRGRLCRSLLEHALLLL